MPPIRRQLVVFTVLFALTNAISYVYVVISGRVLSPEYFAVLNALVGVVSLAGVLASAHQLEVTRLVACGGGHGSFALVVGSATRRALPGIAIDTFGVAGLAMIAGASVLEAFFCTVIVALMFAASAGIGFVAGLGKLELQGAITLLGALCRLVVGWGLMLMGFGASGALLGYVVNYGVILAAARWASKEQTTAVSRLNVTSEVVRYDGTTLWVFFFALAPLTLDQAQVQLFRPEHGGDYAALSNIAKIVYFAVYPLSVVIYPRLLREPNTRIFARFATLGGVAVAATAVALVSVLAIFPGTAERIFFAGRYPQVVPFVGRLAIAMAFFSLCSYATHVLVAKSFRFAVLPPVFGFILGFALFALRNDSLEVLVSNQLWASGVQTCLTALLLMLVVRGGLRKRMRAQR